MVADWTLTAAIGLMVGISFGVLIELRFVVLMDNKIEKLLEKIERMEIKILKSEYKGKKAKTSRRKRR